MCKYPTKIPGLNCRNLKNTIDFEKRWKILDMHNRVRAKFATGEVKGFPRAANMRIMRWDYELEAVALRWAIQCLNRSDPCRKTPRYSEIGQNVAVRTFKKYYGTAQGPYKGEWFPASTLETIREEEEPDFDDKSEDEKKKRRRHPPVDPIQDWVYRELKNANPKDIKPYHFDKATQPLFQVIWAETNRMGCSQVTYLNTQDVVAISWVCNYAPAGVKIGKNVYEPGKTCSKCPSGAECICNWGEPLLLSGSLSIQDGSGRRTRLAPMDREAAGTCEIFIGKPTDEGLCRSMGLWLAWPRLGRVFTCPTCLIPNRSLCSELTDFTFFLHINSEKKRRSRETHTIW
ncbi:hypothetical protein GE061_003409 [Apolygus lucorum]|uniref:SCP domain-containing protein n=1 Tax=Apolygus lucorum TaxID=248454 RepID=A0A8S9X1X8_APOLU|nr:hypothetical protein GE061_003409 [Apolygus lucorum]